MSNPYKYTLTEDKQAYEFITDNGIIYNFYFSLASEHLDKSLPFHNNVYDFSFESVKEKHKSKDARIQDTIIHAIFKLLSDRERVLLYICDSIDNRQYCRKKLFDNWFQKNENGELIKIDFEVEESNAIGSLVLFDDNPNLDQIRSFLEDKIQEYRARKQ